MGGQCQICRNYHEPVAPWLRPIPPLTGNVGRKPYRKLTGVVTVGSDIWSYSNTLAMSGPQTSSFYVNQPYPQNRAGPLPVQGSSGGSKSWSSRRWT